MIGFTIIVIIVDALQSLGEFHEHGTVSLTVKDRKYLTLSLCLAIQQLASNRYTKLYC